MRPAQASLFSSISSLARARGGAVAAILFCAVLALTGGVLSHICMRTRRMAEWLFSCGWFTDVAHVFLCLCRYLQQLVSAQATRNRELEQQLHSYRGGKDSASPSSSTAHTNGEDDALMLHEEVGDFNLSLNGHTASGNPPVLSRRHSSTNGSSRKRFGGFELESVAEMEQDTDHHANDDVHDHDMERPSTSGTGAGASPLSGSGSDDQDHDEHEEEERGRKGRDGRPMGFGHGVAMKMEEGDSMETC